MKKTIVLTTLLAPVLLMANFEKDKETILRQSGCFLIDYNFTEVESLKDGYQLDERVYDTNSDKTTYELIVPIVKSANEIRLQHILFVKDLVTGEVNGMIKHQAEDWAYEPSFVFDFVSTGNWSPLDIQSNSGKWVRKITNLDDGLRYQCAAAWDHTKANSEWNCANFAPIPGRETRDMGRKDYQALDRNTRIISYENSWVERQNNVKTILDGTNRTPLARELGRTWLIRQSTQVCDEAKKLFDERKDFWAILMNVWEEYLGKKESFSEKARVNNESRYGKILGIEEQYFSLVSTDTTARENAKTEIRNVINEFRNENP